MKTFITFLSIGLYAQTAVAQKAKPVMDAEKNFAKYALDSGTKKAFLHFMDENSFVFNRGMIRPGIPVWQSLPENPSKLIWGPSYGALAKLGDLGFTTGAYESRINDTVRGSGQYSTVWQKNTKGEWKFIADLGIGYRLSQSGKQAVSSFEELIPATDNDTSVMALERNFTNEFVKKGPAAYTEFANANTWLNTDGRSPIMYTKAEELEFIPAAIQFIPVQGRTSSSKDLAYVFGYTELNGKRENYLRVWGHTKTGWKILLQTLKWQN